MSRERSGALDDREGARAREDGARKAERQKILDRLNANDTGAHHRDREQEERSAREIGAARENERRPEPGSATGLGG